MEAEFREHAMRWVSHAELTAVQTVLAEVSAKVAQAEAASKVYAPICIPLLLIRVMQAQSGHLKAELSQVLVQKPSRLVFELLCFKEHLPASFLGWEAYSGAACKPHTACGSVSLLWCLRFAYHSYVYHTSQCTSHPRVRTCVVSMRPARTCAFPPAELPVCNQSHTRESAPAFAHPAEGEPVSNFVGAIFGAIFGVPLPPPHIMHFVPLTSPCTLHPCPHPCILNPSLIWLALSNTLHSPRVTLPCMLHNPHL